MSCPRGVWITMSWSGQVTCSYEDINRWRGLVPSSISGYSICTHTIIKLDFSSSFRSIALLRYVPRNAQYIYITRTKKQVRIYTWNSRERCLVSWSNCFVTLYPGRPIFTATRQCSHQWKNPYNSKSSEGNKVSRLTCVYYEGRKLSSQFYHWLLEEWAHQSQAHL